MDESNAMDMDDSDAYQPVHETFVDRHQGHSSLSFYAWQLWRLVSFACLAGLPKVELPMHKDVRLHAPLASSSENSETVFGSIAWLLA